VKKCILCADLAQARKYFFDDKPLCTMHYAEYLEFLIEEKEQIITLSDASSAFSKYKMTLEPTPLSERARAEKAKKEREKKAREESKKKKKASSSPAPSPYSNPFKMGM